MLFSSTFDQFQFSSLSNSEDVPHHLFLIYVLNAQVLVEHEIDDFRQNTFTHISSAVMAVPTLRGTATSQEREELFLKKVEFIQRRRNCSNRGTNGSR